MFLVLACISLIIFELSVFIILAFKTRPVRWTFKSFCLWLVSLVSWCCFPPLYVWIERKWRQASLRRALFVLLSPVSFLHWYVSASISLSITEEIFQAR